MIDVSELIDDSDFAQNFVIYRSQGSFIDGVWTEETPTQIPLTGIIQPASPKELKMLPEGDRITGAIVIYSKIPIFLTRTGEEQGTSDKVYWKGDYYKLLNVSDWSDSGFYTGIAERITGS